MRIHPDHPATLASNASSNKRGKFSRSPLHLGLYRCVEDIVETLIEHSADPFLGDGYSRSGLDWATLCPPVFQNLSKLPLETS